MTDDHATLTTPGGTTFYFPSVAVTRVITKNNTVISLPGQTKGYNRLQFTDKFRLVGNWYDYPTGTYDGKTALSRMKALVELVTGDRRKCSFTWKSKNRFTGQDETDGPHTVMIAAINIDKNPGEGKLMPYVIELGRTTI